MMMNTEGLDATLIAEMAAAGLLTDEEIAKMTGGTAAAVEVPEEVTVTDDMAAAVVKALDADDERAAVYAEQESETTILAASKPVPVVSAPDDAALADPEETEVRDTGKKAKAPGGKRPSRAATSGSLGEFAAKCAGERVMLTDAMEVNVADLVNGINAKKIQDKAANFFHSQHGSGVLSVFTRGALDQLKSAGSLSGKTLADRYMTVGNGGKLYSIGTARSQSQQMMTLFQALKIVRLDEGKWVANEASTYWQSFLKSA